MQKKILTYLVKYQIHFVHLCHAFETYETQMDYATPVAEMKKDQRRYLRVRDDNGEWLETAQAIIEQNKDALYDDERNFDGLVKLFLRHGPTCMQAIAQLPGRPLQS